METNVIFKAKRIDNGKWIEGFFTKKKLTSIFVPVIERIVENDNGDYIESIEVDGNTIKPIENEINNIRYFIIDSNYIIRDKLCFKKHEHKLWDYKNENFPSVYDLEKRLFENVDFYYQPLFIFSKMRITNIKFNFIKEVNKEDYHKFWDIK